MLFRAHSERAVPSDVHRYQAMSDWYECTWVFLQNSSVPGTVLM
jgi:hypothetical protein